VSTLADAGPIVALIDRGQAAVHRKCVDALASLSGPLVTTWPCFTEAMYFLGDLKGWYGQKALWHLVEQGVLRIHIPQVSETERMRILMEKYRDTPMDLADASLVAAAETQKLNRIFTLDNDFRVYRINGTDAFEVVP
jgi:predicted nucleic acid-binding protein